MRRYLAADGKRRWAGTHWMILLAGLCVAVNMAAPLQAQSPALTTISDTVYRADGTPAAGLVLISWPSFETADGYTVTAGNQSVTIGAAGAFTTQLVPNVGATPAGTLYVVVYQLDDGTVRTEYWSVPATASTTIAPIRTTPGTGLGNMAATQQYVNAAVANRALDSTVVHLAGTETITGTKQFTVPPLLPQPVQSGDAANKGYVDASVQNAGSGSYVLITGDTMTGPLNLPADPTAPQQAADRNYVDNGLAAKADLVSGVVPTSELGSGVASSATCLNGNSTWGACGGGAPAGVTYATTAVNWSQTLSTSLTGGTQATVTLSPCPTGVDTSSGAGYQVLLSGGGNSEAVSVVATAGGCASGAASGTITFTPFYSYPAGATISSASSGIQETLNAACGVNSTSYKNSQCNVTIPANGANSSVNIYNVYGTIYFHSNQSVLSGYGTSLNCLGRGPCLQIGDFSNSNDYQSNTVMGLSFRSPTNLSSSPAFAGVPITQTQRVSQIVTITTASAHGFRVGDMVTIMFTDNSAYWGDAFVTAVPSATTFQYTHSGADIAAQATPGVVALAYVAVLDDAEATHLNDIAYDKAGENGSFNNFFDLWDDENTTIEHFSSTSNLTGNANWTGSFIYSAGNQGSHQLAPVITLRDSSITAINPGLTVYNSNGIYIENTVLQSSGPWQVYSSNTTGNYQGAYLKNIYSESSNGANPLTPPKSPFAGTGIAGLIAGNSTSAANFLIRGSSGTQGVFASGGSGSIPYSYFVVVKDAAGSQTSPMQILNYNSTGSDAITVRWPRVANGTDVITYDLIRTTTPIGVNAVFPYTGGCGGGSTTACGSVATGIAQCSGLVCTYTDNGGYVTASYTILQGNYSGNLIFWPGSIVTVNRSVRVDGEESNVVGVGLSSNPAQIADQCTAYGAAGPGAFTDCLGSVTTANNSVPNQTATLLTDGGANGGGQTVSKGRLNLSTSPWAALQPHHIITLIDAQPGLTRATWGYRPPASASDTWIGTDVPSGGTQLSQGQLAFGAPISITNYIAATGDGVHANWLERLSLALKEFNVPVQFDQSATFATNVTVSGNLVLPQGSGFVPTPGGIGLDTAAGLPVVNIGGTNEQIALTSSNISGQAGTAMALAATPTQCSGSFATGIQANGNANCSTPDVIQLAETTQPAGIPNWGVFWFDATTHTPRVIDNNGQVVQLGLTNLFNSDPGGDLADNLEERNGGNAQNFRVYSNYVNSTTWDRISLGSETIGTTNYNVLRSEDATSANALSLGMHIGSSIKWFFVSNGAFKPNSDNSYDIGTDSGQAMHSVFAKTSFNIYSAGRQDFEFPNDTTNGTTLNLLATYNSSASGALTAGTSSTDGVIGIVSGNAGTSGNAVITWAGVAACNFDASNPFAGDFVVASTTQAGKCHDTGSTVRPKSVQVIGRIENDGVRVSLNPPSEGGGGTGGAVSSVFGRTGAVSAQSGDYSVGQVSGAAPTASPTFTGVMTLTDGTMVSSAGWAGNPTFLNNVTINGTLNVAGNINQTGSSPTQWSGMEWSGTTATVPSGMAFSLGVGSDNTFKCQLASGASCVPFVPTSTTVNGHALTSNVTVSASDLTTGTLPHAQLPALVSRDIPNNAANTSGTAANVNGTPALPNGTMATTQSAGDNSTKLATTAYVKNETYFSWTCPVAGTTSISQNCNWTLPANVTITGFDFAANTAPVGCTTYPVVQVWDGTAGAEVGSYSVTLASGAKFYSQVTGSANVALGHQLRIKVTTAASACSAYAAGMVATVTYQMQN